MVYFSLFYATCKLSCLYLIRDKRDMWNSVRGLDCLPRYCCDHSKALEVFGGTSKSSHKSTPVF